MFSVRALSITRGMACSFSRSFASTNNVIFVLGAPGSGKGKHSDNLVAKFGGCHVSVGEILREVRFITVNIKNRLLKLPESILR